MCSNLTQTLSVLNSHPDTQLWSRHSVCLPLIQTLCVVNSDPDTIQVLCLLNSDAGNLLNSDTNTLCFLLRSRHSVCSTLIQIFCVFHYYIDTLFNQFLSRLSLWSTLIHTHNFDQDTLYAQLSSRLCVLNSYLVDTLFVQIFSVLSVCSSLIQTLCALSTNPNVWCTQLWSRHFVFSILIQTLFVHSSHPHTVCAPLLSGHSTCSTLMQTICVYLSDPWHSSTPIMIKILCVLIFYSDILRSIHSVLKFDWDTLCTKMLSRHSVSLTLIQTLCTALIQTLSVLNFDPKTMLTHLISRHSISSTLIQTDQLWSLCALWTRHSMHSILIKPQFVLTSDLDSLFAQLWPTHSVWLTLI